MKVLIVDDEPLAREEYVSVADPDSLDDYLRRADGYQGLRRALFEFTPEQVIAEIIGSAEYFSLV
jgi:NADH:ubiquinone oxidoreductase subunit F (NADH-binding)